MRNRTSLIAFAVIAAIVTTGWTTNVAAQEGSIEGAWIFTSEDGSNQRGLFIFTSANYSMMFVNSDEPRANLDDEDRPTDEAVVAAYNSFTANSGRYTLEGDQITYEAYMAKYPNYMHDWGENAATATVTVDGETLTWTFGGDNPRTFTMRKVG